MQQARLTLVAAAVCVALRTSEAILPIASSCCTEVSHHVSRRLLERVNACSIQRADGDCDLAAVMAVMIWFQNKYEFPMEDASYKLPCNCGAKHCFCCPRSSCACCHCTLACGSLVSQCLTPTFLFMVDVGM